MIRGEQVHEVQGSQMMRNGRNREYFRSGELVCMQIPQKYMNVREVRFRDLDTEMHLGNT